MTERPLEIPMTLWDVLTEDERIDEVSRCKSYSERADRMDSTFAASAVWQMYVEHMGRLLIQRGFMPTGSTLRSSTGSMSSRETGYSISSRIGCKSGKPQPGAKPG